MRCYYCDDLATTRTGRTLTPKQLADNQAWIDSFRDADGKPIFHTGHCPHLELPGLPVCQICFVVYKVIGS